MNTTVLVLPGGKPESIRPARAWHLSALRMRPFTTAIQAAGLPAIQIQYGLRGWNGRGARAISDALTVLENERARRPGGSFILLGHSMGGRVAACLAGQTDVTGVVALAPWWPGGEGYQFRPGQQLSVLHGTADRWTSPDASRREVVAAARRGVHASWTPVEGAGHFMLRKPMFWHQWACEQAVRIAEQE